MCLVVFQKIFRKIFSGVWKMLQGKRQNQKNKHNTQIDAYDRRRSTTRCFANSNSTTLRSSEAPRRFARSWSTAQSRTVSIAIGIKARSQSTARSCEASIAICAKARSRSMARSREALIAISRSTAPIAIDAKANSRSRIAIDGAGACERRRLELGRANGADWVFVSLSRSRSLSLSLFGIHLKWK